MLNVNDVPVKSPASTPSDFFAESPRSEAYYSPMLKLTGETGQDLKPKRRRASPAQLQILSSVFDQTGGFPSTELRRQLAVQLGLTPRTVQIWFQNKRQSLKKQTQLLDSISPPHVRLVSDDGFLRTPPMTPLNRAIYCQEWDTPLFPQPNTGYFQANVFFPPVERRY